MSYFIIGAWRSWAALCLMSVEGETQRLIGDLVSPEYSVACLFPKWLPRGLL